MIKQIKKALGWITEPAIKKDKNKCKSILASWTEETSRIVTATFDSFSELNAIACIDDAISKAQPYFYSKNIQIMLSRTNFNTLKRALTNIDFDKIGPRNSFLSFPMWGYSNVTIIVDTEMSETNNIIVLHVEEGYKHEY